MIARRFAAAARGVVRSFGFAFSGIFWVLRTQRNAKLHVCAGILAVCLGIFRPRIWSGADALSAAEWAILFIAVASVLGAEALNTALESLADAVDEGENIRIKRAKDAAAGGVLLISLGALGAGIAILGPL